MGEQSESYNRVCNNSVIYVAGSTANAFVIFQVCSRFCWQGIFGHESIVNGNSRAPRDNRNYYHDISGSNYSKNFSCSVFLLYFDIMMS